MPKDFGKNLVGSLYHSTGKVALNQIGGDFKDTVKASKSDLDNLKKELGGTYSAKYITDLVFKNQYSQEILNLLNPKEVIKNTISDIKQGYLFGNYKRAEEYENKLMGNDEMMDTLSSLDDLDFGDEDDDVDLDDMDGEDTEFDMEGDSYDNDYSFDVDGDEYNVSNSNTNNYSIKVNNNNSMVSSSLLSLSKPINEIKDSLTSYFEQQNDYHEKVISRLDSIAGNFGFKGDYNDNDDDDMSDTIKVGLDKYLNEDSDIINIGSLIGKSMLSPIEEFFSEGGKFSFVAGMISKMITNPIGYALENFVQDQLPTVLEETVDGFNEHLKKLSRSFLFEMAMGARGFGNIFQRELGRLLNIDIDLDPFKNVTNKNDNQTKEIQHKSIQFDSVTKMAIVKTIPGYLAEILSTVRFIALNQGGVAGGDPSDKLAMLNSFNKDNLMFFDYNTGKFSNRKDVEKAKEKLLKEQINNVMGNITSKIMTGIEDSHDYSFKSTINDIDEFKKKNGIDYLEEFLNNQQEMIEFFKKKNSSTDIMDLLNSNRESLIINQNDDENTRKSKREKLNKIMKMQMDFERIRVQENKAIKKSKEKELKDARHNKNKKEDKAKLKYFGGATSRDVYENNKDKLSEYNLKRKAKREILKQLGDKDKKIVDELKKTEKVNKEIDSINKELNRLEENQKLIEDDNEDGLKKKLENVKSRINLRTKMNKTLDGQIKKVEGSRNRKSQVSTSIIKDQLNSIAENGISMADFYNNNLNFEDLNYFGTIDIDPTERDLYNKLNSRTESLEEHLNHLKELKKINDNILNKLNIEKRKIESRINEIKQEKNRIKDLKKQLKEKEEERDKSREETNKLINEADKKYNESRANVRGKNIKVKEDYLTTELYRNYQSLDNSIKDIEKESIHKDTEIENKLISELENDVSKASKNASNLESSYENKFVNNISDDVEDSINKTLFLFERSSMSLGNLGHKISIDDYMRPGIIQTTKFGPLYQMLQEKTAFFKQNYPETFKDYTFTNAIRDWSLIRNQVRHDPTVITELHNSIVTNAKNVADELRREAENSENNNLIDMPTIHDQFKSSIFAKETEKVLSKEDEKNLKDLNKQIASNKVNLKTYNNIKTTAENALANFILKENRHDFLSDNSTYGSNKNQIMQLSNKLDSNASGSSNYINKVKNAEKTLSTKYDNNQDSNEFIKEYKNAMMIKMADNILRNSNGKYSYDEAKKQAKDVLDTINLKNVDDINKFIVNLNDYDNANRKIEYYRNNVQNLEKEQNLIQDKVRDVKSTNIANYQKEINNLLKNSRLKDKDGNYVLDKYGNFIYTDKNAQQISRFYNESILERSKNGLNKSTVNRLNYINKIKFRKLENEKRELNKKHMGLIDTREGSIANPDRLKGGNNLNTGVDSELNAYSQILNNNKLIEKRIKKINKELTNYNEEMIEMEETSKEFEKQRAKMLKRKKNTDERYKSISDIYKEVKDDFEVDLDWIPIIGPAIGKVVNGAMKPILGHAKSLVTWLGNELSRGVDNFKAGLSRFFFGNDSGMTDNLSDAFKKWLYDEKNPLSAMFSDKTKQKFRDEQRKSQDKMNETLMENNNQTRQIYEAINEGLGWQKNIFGETSTFGEAMTSFTTPGSAYVNSIEGNTLLNNIYAFITGRFSEGKQYEPLSEDELERMAQKGIANAEAKKIRNRAENEKKQKEKSDKKTNSLGDEYHTGNNVTKDQKKENRETALENIKNYFSSLPTRINLNLKQRLIKAGTNRSLLKKDLINPDTEENYNLDDNLADLIKGRMIVDVINPFKKFIIGTKVSEEERKKMMEDGLLTIIKNKFDTDVIKPFRKALLGDEEDDGTDGEKGFTNLLKKYAKLKVLDPLIDFIGQHSPASFNPSWLSDYKKEINELVDQRDEYKKNIDSSNSNLNLIHQTAEMNKKDSFLTINDQGEFVNIANSRDAIDRYNKLLADKISLETNINNIKSKGDYENSETLKKDIEASEKALKETIKAISIINGTNEDFRPDENGNIKFNYNGKDYNIQRTKENENLYKALAERDKNQDNYDTINRQIEASERYMYDKNIRNRNEFNNLSLLNKKDFSMFKGLNENNKENILREIFNIDENGKGKTEDLTNLGVLREQLKMDKLYNDTLDMSDKDRLDYFKNNGIDEKKASVYIATMKNPNTRKSAVTSEKLYNQQLEKLKSDSLNRMSLSGRLKYSLIGKHNDDIDPSNRDYLTTNDSYFNILKTKFTKAHMPGIKKMIGGKYVDLSKDLSEILSEKVEEMFRKPKIGLEKFILGKDKKDFEDDNEIYQQGLLGVIGHKFNAISNRFKDKLIGEDEDIFRARGLDVDDKKDSLLSFALHRIDIDIFDKFKNYLIGDDEQLKSKYQDKSLLTYMFDDFKTNVIDKMADYILGEKDVDDGLRHGQIAEFFRKNEGQLKRMGVTAMTGSMIGRYFGHPLLGAAIGLVTGTDEFKNAIYNKDNPDSLRNQLIYKVIGKDKDKFKNMNGESLISFLFKRMEISIFDPIKYALFGGNSDEKDIKKKYRIGLIEGLRSDVDNFLFLRNKTYKKEVSNRYGLFGISSERDRQFRDRGKKINERVNNLDSEHNNKLKDNLKTIITEDLSKKGINFEDIDKGTAKTILKKYKKLNNLGAKNKSDWLSNMLYYKPMKEKDEREKIKKPKKINYKKLERLNANNKKLEDLIYKRRKKIEEFDNQQKINRDALEGLGMNGFFTNIDYNFRNSFGYAGQAGRKFITPITEGIYNINNGRLNRFNNKVARNQFKFAYKDSLTKNIGIGKNAEIARNKHQLDDFFDNLTHEVSYHVSNLFKNIGKKVGNLLHFLFTKTIFRLLKAIFKRIVNTPLGAIGRSVFNGFQKVTSGARQRLGDLNEKMRANRLNRAVKSIYGDNEVLNARMMQSDDFKKRLMESGEAKLHQDYWINKEKAEKTKNELDITSLKQRIKDGNFEFNLNNATDREFFNILKTNDNLKSKYSSFLKEDGSLKTGSLNEEMVMDTIDALYNRNSEIKEKARKAKLHPENYDFNGNLILSDEEKNKQKIFADTLTDVVGTPVKGIKELFEHVAVGNSVLYTYDKSMFDLIRKLTPEEEEQRLKDKVFNNANMSDNTELNDLRKQLAETKKNKGDTTEIEEKIRAKESLIRENSKNYIEMMDLANPANIEKYKNERSLDENVYRTMDNYKQVTNSILSNYSDAKYQYLHDNIERQIVDFGGIEDPMSNDQVYESVFNSLNRIGDILLRNTGPDGDKNCINVHDYHLVEAIRQGFDSLGGHVNKDINSSDMNKSSNEVQKPKISGSDKTDAKTLNQQLENRDKSFNEAYDNLNNTANRFRNNTNEDENDGKDKFAATKKLLAPVLRPITNVVNKVKSGIDTVKTIGQAGKEIGSAVINAPKVIKNKIGKIFRKKTQSEEYLDAVQNAENVADNARDKAFSLSRLTGVAAIHRKKKDKEEEDKNKVFKNIERNTGETSKSFKGIGSLKSKFAAIKTFALGLFTKFIKPIGNGISKLVTNLLPKLGSGVGKATSGLGKLFGIGGKAAVGAEGATATAATAGATGAGATAAGGAAAGLLGTIAGIVGGAVIAIGTGISDYKKGKEKGYTGTKMLATTLLGDAGDSFKDTLKNAGKQALKYGGLGLTIGTIACPGIGSAIGAGIGAIVGLIGGLLGNDPKKSIENLKEGFSGIKDKIKETFSSIGEKIKERFGDTAKYTLKYGAAGALIGSIFPGAGTVIGAGTGALLGLVGGLTGHNPADMLQKLKEGLGKITGKVKEIFTSIGDKIKETFGATGLYVLKYGGAGALIGSVIPGVGTLLGGGIGALVGLIGGIVGHDPAELLGKLKEGFKAIGSAFKKAFSKIGEGLSKIGSAFFGKDGILTKVIEVFKKLFVGIKDGIVKAFVGIKDFVVESVDKIKTKISNIVDNVKKTFTDIKENIGPYVKELIENVKTFFINGFNKVKETISNIIENVKKTFSEIKEFVSNFITDKVEKVKNFFGDIKEKASSIIDNIKSTFTEIKEFISNFITDKIEKVKNFFSKVKEDILGVFDFIGSLLPNAANFITSKVSSFTDKVKNFFSSDDNKQEEKEDNKETKQTVLSSTSSSSLLDNVSNSIKLLSDKLKEFNDSFEVSQSVNNNETTLAQQPISVNSTASVADYQSNLIQNINITNNYLSNIVNVLNEINKNISSGGNGNSTNNKEIENLLENIYETIKNNGNNNKNETKNQISMTDKKREATDKQLANNKNESTRNDNFFFNKNSQINLKPSTINIAKGK